MVREENKSSGKQTVLHVCCGPCASACVPRLKDAGREVTMLFANSNIDTAEEFEHRRAEAERLAAHDGVAFASLPYDHADWLEKVAKGFEDAPEKGETLGALVPLSPPQAASKSKPETAATATQPRKDIFPHQKFFNNIRLS